LYYDHIRIHGVPPPTTTHTTTTVTEEVLRAYEPIRPTNNVPIFTPEIALGGSTSRGALFIPDLVKEVENMGMLLKRGNG